MNAMKKIEVKLRLFHLIFSLLLLLLCYEARSQKTTEVFIPIGKSPGASGKTTKMGKVESVRTQDYSVTMMLDDQTKATIKIEKSTAIYLDKSIQKQPNTRGKWEDIKPGLLMEAKYSEINKSTCEWIKVQVK